MNWRFVWILILGIYQQTGSLFVPLRSRVWPSITFYRRCVKPLYSTDPSTQTKTDDKIDIEALSNRIANSENHEKMKDVMNRLSSSRPYINIVIERLGQTIDDWQLSNKIKNYEKLMNSKPRLKDSLLEAKPRERIVILGTGWASHSLCKSIDSTKYEVIVISPRNYFLFTPMLAASAVGTVEFKSICEPIRNVNPFVDYLEASATRVHVNNNTITCSGNKIDGTSSESVQFNVPYDYLVIAVGAKVNTYGIKGVQEHCLYLKQIEDAVNIRRSIISCFERANVPGLSEDEIKNILSFVIVGAGPTGVEFTGELRDWVETEGKKYFSHLLKHVKISLIEAGNTILPVFEKDLRDEALKSLTQRQTILIEEGLVEKEITSVILQAGVKEVFDKTILLSTGETIPYGFCVWAAGNGCLPFVEEFLANVEEQKQLQSTARGRIVTDRWLKVIGTKNVFSIGDCSFIQDKPLPATAQVASQGASYIGRLFSKQYYMKTPANVPPIKCINISTTAANDNATTVQVESSNSPLEELIYFSENTKIGSLGMTLSKIYYDSGLTGNGTAVELAVPFQFLNLGVLAYVGASKALAQVSVDDQTIAGSGFVGYLLWRGVYWSKQVSWRNRLLVGIDWVRSRVFGRDIGIF